MTLKFFKLLLFLMVYISSEAQTCRDLPEQFYSYSQAISAIKNSTFKTTDNLPSGKSSWIVNASFFSCDGRTGFLVYRTDKGNNYVHENVPISIWTQFKNAGSSGSYYVSYIKGRYRLVPD